MHTMKTMKLQTLSQRELLVMFVVITSWTCITMGIKLDLNASCSGTSQYYCTLTNITSSFEEPLVFIVNSTADNLNELLIYHSVLARLPATIFEIAPKLHTLILHNCGVNRILGIDFEKAQQLHKLMMQKNRLFNIPERVFASMYALEELYLSYNTIHMIHRLAFVGLSKLKYLDLRGNGIRTLPVDVFGDLGNLEHIDLSNNEIEVINGNTFLKNLKLNTLLLSDNKFSVFEPSSLMHLQHLHVLDLSYTLLEELRVQSVDLLMVQSSGLKECIISGAVTKLNAANNALKGLAIQDKLAVRELELHGNLLETLDNIVGMLNLQKLDVSKNLLTSLKTSHSPLYLPLPNLNSLNLASNHLQNLSVQNFMFMSKLKYLDLAFNRLIRLEASTFEPLFNLEKFFIEGNRLTGFDYVELKHSHNFLHEVGIFENDWEFRYLKRMLNYLRGHDIHLPMRFTPSDSSNTHDEGKSATEGTSSKPLQSASNWPHGDSDDVDILNDMSHARQSSGGLEKHLTDSHQQQQSLIGVSGIHPYWTTRDVLALLTLIVVLLILILMFFHIMQEEQFWPFCCRRYFNVGNRETEALRPRRHRPLVEDNSDV